MFSWFKKKICSHEFEISDIQLTGIPDLAMPKWDSSYAEWETYHKSYYKCDGVTKRVSCKCRKCGNVFFAHCGLDLDGKLTNDNKEVI
jgi:hypothetical protein